VQVSTTSHSRLDSSLHGLAFKPTKATSIAMMIHSTKSGIVEPTLCRPMLSLSIMDDRSPSLLTDGLTMALLDLVVSAKEHFSSYSGVSQKDFPSPLPPEEVIANAPLKTQLLWTGRREIELFGLVSSLYQ
jgi:hypothetical protein